MEQHEIRKRLKKELDKGRYEHTKGVMYTAGCMAMAYETSIEQAMLAGLLHDCAKCIPDDEKLQICEEHDIPINAVEYESPFLLHAKLGAYLAETVYEVKDPEILHAIKVHTTGAPDMSTLDKIIYIADYIEPGRNKAADLPRVRKLAFEDLDTCMAEILCDTNFLHLHSGTMGAGHGHSDKLHIDLVVNGEDVLMDGGRYTYVSGPKRFSYKDPSGHNTITVDDLPFTVCKDSWECSKLSQPVKENFRCMELAEFAQAGQLGYMDLPGGVYVNRKVVYIKPDLYVLADEMYTGDRHTYQQYFHFNNHGTVTQNAPGEKKFPCVAYRGKMAEADFYFVSAQVKAELKSGHIARHYNVEEENTVCKVTKQGEGFTSLITVIDAQPGRPLSIVRNAEHQLFYSLPFFLRRFHL